MHYVAEQGVISVEPILNMDRQAKTGDIYQEVALEESNEELKMDLAGYVGDFHRHRID